MKIKTKISFGVGLLFLMILALSLISGWSVHLLKRDTHNILVANYNTLEYARNMLLALERLPADPKASVVFEENLKKQKANITEAGESLATQKIEENFSALKGTPTALHVYPALRTGITEVMHLNMEAIEKKSAVANRSAEDAVLMISLAGSLCFIIAFVLLVNMPSSIADPIQELTRSIKEIAAENYKQRVHFEEHNEYGDLAKSFNTMAKKLEEYADSKMDKILKAKKRIETLIENMHDPVIGLDENGKVLFANAEAEHICGVKKTDLVGNTLQQLALQNDLLRDILQVNHHHPLRIYAHDKEGYYDKEVIDLNIVPTGETAAIAIGRVILLRDITPYKELDAAKTNFVGAVSHEIKTPLASIQMSTQLIEKFGTLNEEQQGLVHSIREDTDRLLKITTELLHVGQIESDAIAVHKIHTSAAHLVQDALHAVHSLAEQKQVSTRLETPENDLMAWADPDKTTWVLTNLIGNALHYAHENSTVGIKISEGAQHLKFSVTDQGQGIAPPYLSRIFERYFRIPGSHPSGTGLGLSICKAYVEAQGGEIGVSSELGVGSTFYFTLPKQA